MNLVEKLIKADKSKAFELDTKKIKSKKLSKIIGEPTEITIRELHGDEVNDINQIALNKDGGRDSAKMYDVNVMYCVKVIVDPSMKDETLMKEFGAATPKDLVKKLFDSEAFAISDEIVKLTGITKESEEEVKNS